MPRRPIRLLHGLWHHCSMFTSDAVTRGIKVHVESEYAAERSQPSQNQWFFLYTITICRPASSATPLSPAGLISRDEPIANRSPAMTNVSPRCTRARKSGMR